MGLGASLGAGLLLSFWRSEENCSDLLFWSLSFLNSLTRISTISSSTRVLGLSSIEIFFLCKNSITVGSATLRSFATLLIFVFAICLFKNYACFELEEKDVKYKRRVDYSSSNSALRICNTSSTVSSSRSALSISS